MLEDPFHSPAPFLPGTSPPLTRSTDSAYTELLNILSPFSSPDLSPLITPALINRELPLFSEVPEPIQRTTNPLPLDWSFPALPILPMKKMPARGHKKSASISAFSCQLIF